MEGKGKKFLRFISYILAAAIGAGIMYFAKPAGKLEELSGILEERFIGETNVTAIEDAAASAMVLALGDKWSYYIPKSNYDAHVNGQNNVYVGIGITIRGREDGIGVDVEQVEPDGPAQKAGMLPGDILIDVDGQSLAGMNVTQTKKLVQGEEGTDVTITVLRDGKELTFTMTRSKIQVHVVKYEMLSGNVGYVRIANFSFHSAEAALAAVEDLRGQGAQALIFDVRNNPGGFVSELVAVLDYLLPEGVLFRSIDYKGNEEVDMSDASCLELPMAVLVNGNSYSAAEFFAAALSEYNWATVVGERTTGKGHFQSTITLSDGSAVNLSIGKYTTPNGVNLTETQGIVPDVEVPVDEELAAMIYSDLVAPEDDPQIQAALESLVK